MVRGYHTLAAPVVVEGVGLHCGMPVTARLLPRETAGVVFRRTDLDGRPGVPASISCVTQTVHATTLKQGEASVSTTEHLLAALWALDVTHCEVELNGPEVPILDGSSAPWIDVIQAAGLEPIEGPRPVWTLIEPVWVEDGDTSVLGLPHPELRVSVAVDFGHPFAGPQSVDFALRPGVFERELAPARTFTLESWVPRLLEAGLIRGGSEQNAVVLRDAGPSSPWRMPQEIARHKALDLVGDMALGFADSGAGFAAHLIAIRAGHGGHRQWLETCLKRDAFVCLRR